LVFGQEAAKGLQVPFVGVVVELPPFVVPFTIGVPDGLGAEDDWAETEELIRKMLKAAARNWDPNIFKE
jgi:hypothetical protein